MITPVILAGGSGTRLWPASRKLKPKQFLNLTDTKLSLFQQTVLRASRISNTESPIIVCNEEHRFLVAEQLMEIKIKAQHILLEPCPKNTAPAITLAALLHPDPQAELLVLPADHLLEESEDFYSAVRSAHALAEKGYLCTFGILPNKPETGYGYIEKGKLLSDQCYEIARFVEKPDLESATRYLESENFLWNSGKFFFPKQALINELESYQADILAICKAAIEQMSQDVDFTRISSNIFNDCPSESIDYALMELTQKAAVIRLDTNWSDIGAWDALWENSIKDDCQNSIFGDVITEDTSNSLIHAHNRLVATLGINNAVVIETKDAVLVADKALSQDVKKVVGLLELASREELNSHVRTYRPWGWYESICIGMRFQVKRILVKPGGCLSLQKHRYRAEHWVIVKGKAKVTNGEEVAYFNEDQSTYIPIGNIHRLENPQTEPLEIIEIQTGSYLGEDDIERLEDQYGRAEG